MKKKAKQGSGKSKGLSVLNHKVSYNQRGWLTETGSVSFDGKMYYNSPSGTSDWLGGNYRNLALEENDHLIFSTQKLKNKYIIY